MAFRLPAIPRPQFDARVAALSPEPLVPSVLDSLYAIYEELARWNRKVNLVGPGTAGEILERHFGESLAALPWIPPGMRVGLDLGSGAGFPGIGPGGGPAGARHDPRGGPGTQVGLPARRRPQGFIALPVPQC